MTLYIMKKTNVETFKISLLKFGELQQNVYTSTFINDIKSKFNKIKVQTNEIIQLPKINNIKEYPIIFKILNKVGYLKKIGIDTYLEFLKWHNKNFTNINFKEILQHYNQYYNEIFNNTNDVRKILNNSLYNNSFVSLDIIHCSESTNLFFEQIKDSNTNIKIFYSKDRPNIDLIMSIFNLFRKLYGDMQIDLTVFMCMQKRYLPKNGKFTPENINAGSTFPGESITIWREEEFYKVLIHELVHYFDADFHMLSNTKLEHVLNKTFKLKGHDVANEAYTEILALTINSVIYSNLYNEDFSVIINFEILFTHLQIAKIILACGGNTYDDLYKVTIHQSTSVLSYVIIKGILLNNYNEILIHFDKKFKNIKEKYNDYVLLYTRLVSNKNSLNINLINKFIENIKSFNKFESSTLKMILHEI